MPHPVPGLPNPKLERTSLGEALLVVLSPALAYWLMNFQPVMQNGFLDPYIYTAFIHNFSDLFQRYGTTYYGVRFGTIVPGQIGTALFGPIAGYFAVRWVMALIAGVPFYLLARQRYGRVTAIVVFALLMTSPFLARTLLWDHPDSTGVPFLFAAICLYSIEHPKRRLVDAIAGTFAGLAVHSNVFTLAPLGMFYGVHAALWLAYRRTPRELVRRLMTIAIAIVAVSAAGSALYWLRIGRADIFTITVNMSLSLTAGQMENWRIAGFDWVARQWWIFAPVALVLFVPMVWVRTRIDFHDAVLWTSATVVTLFYYVYQFLLNGTFLQLFYYFSYLLPFIFLLLMLVASALLDLVDRPTQWRVMLVLLAAAIGPWVLWSFEQSVLLPASLVQYLGIVLLTTVLVIAAVRTSFRSPGMTFAAATALGLTVAGSFAGPDQTTSVYRTAVNSRVSPSSLQMDVYRVALDFMKAVPPLAERPGEILFWYSNRPPRNPMQSIQSTYLWGYSKLQGDGPGLPALEPRELKTILEPRVKWLGLLAEREEQLAEARAKLVQNDVAFDSVGRKAISHGTYTLYVEFLGLRKSE